MARELFGATDKSKIDATGTYHLHDVLVSEAAVLVDMYAMRVDGSAEAIIHMQGIHLRDYDSRALIANGGTIDLGVNQLLVVYADALSTAVDDRSVQFEFRDAAGKRTWSVDARITVVSLALYADFDRDGQVDATPAQSKQWTWGAQGQGAVLLVNSDRDTAHPNLHFRDRRDRRVNGPLDLEDMTPVEVEVVAPVGLDLSPFSVRMHVSDAAASRVRVFDLDPVLPEAVIGPGMPSVTWTPKRGRRQLRLEGLDFSDSGFSGLITIVCELERTGESYGGDKLILRVAPWLALPNTQPASTVYIAEMQDGTNKASIAGIKEVAAAASVQLIIVPPNVNRADRWLQDEIEIGYASRPGKAIPVVLDSPRDRQLDDFPELMLLGPDFGYVTRGNDEERSSLDSFGNLDCTPPHVGPKGHYPFGRIVFGGAQPGARGARRMMKAVSDFMYAQQVQYPIELFSDWLTVGHVDEFMSFVSAPDRQRFRLVLASPATAYRVLEKVKTDGHGAVLFMKGKRHEMTVNALLAAENLRKQNALFQKFINSNKAVLIKEMGLQPADIVELPALYFAESGNRAGAFFPGMVNMQVLNGHLAIPKPFGPIVGGKCAFETFTESVLTPLGLTCHFVDTYEGYHLQMGEIHCGTNVVRAGFEAEWWAFDPSINAVEIPDTPR